MYRRCLWNRKTTLRPPHRRAVGRPISGCSRCARRNYAASALSPPLVARDGATEAEDAARGLQRSGQERRCAACGRAEAVAREAAAPACRATERLSRVSGAAALRRRRDPCDTRRSVVAAAAAMTAQSRKGRRGMEDISNRPNSLFCCAFRCNESCLPTLSTACGPVLFPGFPGPLGKRATALLPATDARLNPVLRAFQAGGTPARLACLNK